MSRARHGSVKGCDTLRHHLSRADARPTDAQTNIAWASRRSLDGHCSRTVDLKESIAVWFPNVTTARSASRRAPGALVQLLDAPAERPSRAQCRTRHTHVNVVRRRRRSNTSARIQRDAYPRQLVIRAVPGSVHIREPEHHTIDVRGVRAERVIDPPLDVCGQRRRKLKAA